MHDVTALPFMEAPRLRIRWMSSSRRSRHHREGLPTDLAALRPLRSLGRQFNHGAWPMRASPRRRHVPATMDVMRPSLALGGTPTSDVHDPRRWMRLVLLTLAGAGAILPLLGATAAATID
jgi:hypothetical protein